MWRPNANTCLLPIMFQAKNTQQAIRVRITLYPTISTRTHIKNIKGVMLKQ